jgi:hypothetical protein
MKTLMRLFLFFLTATMVTTLFSCDPCSNLDCASDNYYGQFRIVSASTGNDLVFGTNRVYDKNQIKFYSLKGTDTTFFEYQTIKFGGTGYDSILYVRFYPQTDVTYMRLSNGDIDTLNISYKTTQTKCCGSITEITNFRHNNAVDVPGDKGTQELKK